MSDLVIVKGDDAFTNSLIIAEHADIQHHSITRLIRKHKEDFQYFGKVRFMDLKSINSSGGRPIRVYDLNEQQATLLLTYLDNTVAVRAFKKNLVEQFYNMKRLLLERQSTEWLQTRKHGKLTRRHETDVIAELIEYATGQGSKNANKMYISYSKMVNKLVGLGSGQREYATEKVLTTIAMIEDLILHTIKEEMERGTYYKDIYRICKRKSNEMMKYIYLPEKRILIA